MKQDVEKYCLQCDCNAAKKPSKPRCFHLSDTSWIMCHLGGWTDHFHLRLDDVVRFDPKSIASLSRKMAVLQLEPLCPLSSFTSAIIKKERMNHFATSLRIDSISVKAVSKLPKQQDQAEPVLFAESYLESMPSPATMLHKEPQVLLKKKSSWKRGSVRMSITLYDCPHSHLPLRSRPLVTVRMHLLP